MFLLSKHCHVLNMFLTHVLMWFLLIKKRVMIDVLNFFDLKFRTVAD